MTVPLLVLVLSCGSDGGGEPRGWTHHKGRPAANVLDTDDILPDMLICEGSYALMGSHSTLVDDCEGYGAGETDMVICTVAYGNAIVAAEVTRCPEPPPVSCPKRVRENWRGWRCGESPGLTGTFASCAVQVQIGCSQ